MTTTPKTKGFTLIVWNDHAVSVKYFDFHPDSDDGISAVYDERRKLGQLGPVEDLGWQIIEGRADVSVQGEYNLRREQ
jgi:hypothetical protein